MLATLQIGAQESKVVCAALVLLKDYLNDESAVDAELDDELKRTLEGCEDHLRLAYTVTLLARVDEIIGRYAAQFGQEIVTGKTIEATEWLDKDGDIMTDDDTPDGSQA